VVDENKRVEIAFVTAWEFTTQGIDTKEEKEKEVDVACRTAFDCVLVISRNGYNL
jgi:hypothetical protein